MGIMDAHRPRWFAHNIEGEMELQVLTAKGWRWEKEVVEERKEQAKQREIEDIKEKVEESKREKAEKAMQSSPANDDITEIAIDEAKEVTEEDYERVREWAAKRQGKPIDKP